MVNLESERRAVDCIGRDRDQAGRDSLIRQAQGLVLQNEWQVVSLVRPGSLGSGSTCHSDSGAPRLVSRQSSQLGGCQPIVEQVLLVGVCPRLTGFIRCVPAIAIAIAMEEMGMRLRFRWRG